MNMKPFSPIVKFIGGVVGQKKFNVFRGRVISVHSQVIGDFCKFVGAPPKMKQELIRVAKANGSKLGFLD